MKIEYNFNKEELKLICECLDVAKDDIIHSSSEDYTNIVKLRENIVSLINLTTNLNELE